MTPSQLANLVTSIITSSLQTSNERRELELQEEIFYSILSFIKDNNNENLETSSRRVQQEEPNTKANLTKSCEEPQFLSHEEAQAANGRVIKVRRTNITDYFYTEEGYKPLPSLTQEIFNEARWIYTGKLKSILLNMGKVSLVRTQCLQDVQGII